MSQHVKRGMEIHIDREVTYDPLADDPINAIWHCDECGDKLELRQRGGRHAYVEIGCGCGAVSVDVRIADVMDLDIDKWDTKIPSEVGRDV